MIDGTDMTTSVRAHDEPVGHAASECRHAAENDAHAQADGSDEDGDRCCRARPPQDAAQHIAPQLVRAQPMVGARRFADKLEILFHERVGRDGWAENRQYEQD